KEWQRGAGLLLRLSSSLVAYVGTRQSFGVNVCRRFFVKPDEVESFPLEFLAAWGIGLDYNYRVPETCLTLMLSSRSGVPRADTSPPKASFGIEPLPSFPGPPPTPPP